MSGHKKLTVLDLFSGIGGFSLGLERTGGFETTAFCEIDPFCRKVLHKHWPGVLKFNDVKTLRPEKDDYDVICGGFPCQDISVAGKQKGIDGERSGLWKEFHRIIKKVQPRWVIIENVANLRSKGLASVLKDLWKIGYDCEWHIISASSVNAPHLRERCWVIAYPNITALREQSRGRVRKDGKSTTLFGQSCEEGATSPSYPNGELRLWKSFTSQEETFGGWATTSLGINHWGEVEPPVCGVDDGLSRKLDTPRRSRLKALGNSVVPQIPELIGRAILDYVQ